MIVGTNAPDIHNKLKRYEAKIKELESTVKAQEDLIKAQGALIAGNADQIGKLKCRIADLRLAVRRKGGASKEDEQLMSDED